MAIIKAQNNKRNAANTGYDIIHHETEASIVLMDDGVTKLSDRLKIQTATGTATAITLAGVELINGFQLTFVVLSSNSGAATTINSKPLYKPGTTTAPKLVAGKAATVWYNTAGGCFFIKASAEGTAVAGDVLAGKTFSNDDDTGLTGTFVIPHGSQVYTTPGTYTFTVPANVTQAMFFAAGAGGGGGGGGGYYGYSGGPGGGGGSAGSIIPVVVTPQSTFAVVVGARGNAGAGGTAGGAGTAGTAGGNSSISDRIGYGGAGGGGGDGSGGSYAGTAGAGGAAGAGGTAGANGTVVAGSGGTGGAGGIGGGGTVVGGTGGVGGSPGNGGVASIPGSPAAGNGKVTILW